MLGDSRFLLHDEFPERGLLSPLAYQGTAVTLHLYVDDVDDVFGRAVQAGAEVLMPVADDVIGPEMAVPDGAVTAKLEAYGPV